MHYISKDTSSDQKSKKQLLKIAQRSDLLKRVMYAEQSLTYNQQYKEIAIEVEATYLGSNIENLKYLISLGYNCPTPYNYASFRVLN